MPANQARVHDSDHNTGNPEVMPGRFFGSCSACSRRTTTYAKIVADHEAARTGSKGQLEGQFNGRVVVVSGADSAV